MTQPTVGNITRAIQRACREHKRNRTTNGPNWVKIARRHFKRYGKKIGKPVKFSGPFGLRCAFVVELGRKRREFEINNHDGWHIGKRDHSKLNTLFRPGSIGWMNGMQHPYIEIPNKTPLADLFK